jgi:hypothetical protein
MGNFDNFMGNFDNLIDDCKCCAANAIDYSDIPLEDFNKWHAFTDKWPEFMLDILATDGFNYAVVNLNPSFRELDEVEPFTHWRYLPLLGNTN